MDVQVVKEVGGKKYNQFNQEVVSCQLCKDGTTSLRTKHCDRCYELDSRISMDLELAEKILRFYRPKSNWAKFISVVFCLD